MSDDLADESTNVSNSSSLESTSSIRDILSEEDINLIDSMNLEPERRPTLDQLWSSSFIQNAPSVLSKEQKYRLFDLLYA
jgi:hypothetical protein